MIAVLVPNIWVVIGFVGSICSTSVNFVFPSCVIYAFSTKAYRGQTRMWARALSVLLFTIGMFLMVNGIVSPLMNRV